MVDVGPFSLLRTSVEARDTVSDSVDGKLENFGPLPPLGMLFETDIVMLLLETAVETVANTVDSVVIDVEVCVIRS